MKFHYKTSKLLRHFLIKSFRNHKEISNRLPISKGCYHIRCFQQPILIFLYICYLLRGINHSRSQLSRIVKCTHCFTITKETVCKTLKKIRFSKFFHNKSLEGELQTIHKEAFNSIAFAIKQCAFISKKNWQSSHKLVYKLTVFIFRSNLCMYH